MGNILKKLVTKNVALFPYISYNSFAIWHKGKTGTEVEEYSKKNHYSSLATKMATVAMMVNFASSENIVKPKGLIMFKTI